MCKTSRTRGAAETCTRYKSQATCRETKANLFHQANEFRVDTAESSRLLWQEVLDVTASRKDALLSS
jgi:hypothetical protein